MAAESRASEPADLELVITRIFDAPRELVFKAWTEPEMLVKWWGPRNFTLPSCKIELRPGGSFLFQMRGPNGDDSWSRGVFREVIRPKLVVMSGGWTDAGGKLLSPEMVTTVTFEEYEGKTRLTLRQAGIVSVESRESHRGGWNGSFDRLAEYLASRP
jgi:uncharacterized protein YndB with AHSA1/START domain